MNFMHRLSHPSMKKLKIEFTNKEINLIEFLTGRFSEYDIKEMMLKDGHEGSAFVIHSIYHKIKEAKHFPDPKLW